LGIQSGTTDSPGGSLAQIGFLRYWNTAESPPGVSFCTFEEDVPIDPTPITIDCSTVANDVYEWVKIEENGLYYDIRDCGVSDPTFASCMLIAEAPLSNFPDSFGTDIAEGDGNCSAVQIMGSSSDVDNMGSSTYPVEDKNSSTDPWSSRTTKKHVDGPACSDYQEDITGDGIVGTYDDRNVT
jgi:hypothetical protein